jgi:GH25 family lysozyme M1 (1,4-beta-N-acetylmuramidase)
MMKGVDISKWQAKLTIAQIKGAGYEFAIIRGGYSSNGAIRTKNIDKSFENFYQQAKAIGFPVGAYYYSTARNSAEGLAEAKYFYEKCLKGKQFEMPIYIDVEDERWQGKDKNGVTNAIIEFCNYLESKNLYVGVYASLSWFNTKIDVARLKYYTKCVAKWVLGANAKPTVSFSAFDMWQYTDRGRIAGQNIDENIAYIDFPTVIKKANKNGFIDVNSPKPQETAPPKQSEQSKVAKIHVVKKDETLSGIALMYNTTVDALVKKNGIKDKNKIYVGQRLKI